MSKEARLRYAASPTADSKVMILESSGCVIETAKDSPKAAARKLLRDWLKLDQDINVSIQQASRARVAGLWNISTSDRHEKDNSGRFLEQIVEDAKGDLSTWKATLELIAEIIKSDYNSLPPVLSVFLQGVLRDEILPPKKNAMTNPQHRNAMLALVAAFISGIYDIDSTRDLDNDQDSSACGIVAAAYNEIAKSQKTVSYDTVAKAAPVAKDLIEILMKPGEPKNRRISF